MKVHGTVESSTLDENFKINIDELTLSDDYVFKIMIENSLAVTKAEEIKKCLIKDLPLDIRDRLNLTIQNVNYSEGFKIYSRTIIEKILFKADLTVSEDLLQILSKIITLSSQRITFKSKPNLGQFQQFLGLLIFYSKDLTYLKPICYKMISLYNASDRKILKTFEYDSVRTLQKF